MANSAGKTYDVFLSFRGVDTRSSFVSHLFTALCRRSFRVFNDNDLMGGRASSFARATRAAIKESKVSVVVLSENYASSKPCLEELVEILKCRRKDGQIVIPVFYRVSWSDMEHLTGRIAVEFEQYKKSHSPRVSTWQAALKETAAIAGHQPKDEQSDAELVEAIVQDVQEKLFLIDENRPVGIESRMLEIEDMLCKQPWGIRILGIWGMGGIGKTTIAKAAFDRMSANYEASYFLLDFDKRSHQVGLKTLREEYLEKVVGREESRKRVFLVLDDVHNAMDAEAVVGGGGFDEFGPGSIIIITSRDKRVLLQYCNKVNQIYQVRGLDKQESKQLFSRRAFGRDEITERKFHVVSMKVIEYAKGNPLALEFFAKKLKGKRLTEWETLLHKLKQRPVYPIMDVMKRSYDALSLNEKKIFLDLACFFTGEDIDKVIQLLDGCGFVAHFGIDVLVKMSFFAITERRVDMHDLIKSIGREIVNRESVDPARRSRLWDSSSIQYVLERALGTEEIEGIFFDTSKSSFDVPREALDSMYNLRLLKIYSSNPEENNSGIYFPKGLASLPYELRLLHWENCPLNVMPEDFNSSNLVELNMPYSKLQKLWKGHKVQKNLEMLKTLRLCHSQELTEIFRLSEAHNLVHIDLQGCKSLLLTSLDTSDLKHLKLLNLSGCIQLQNFPEVPLNLKELYLQGTGISEIPAPSLELLSGLLKLDLGNCKRLVCLPRNIYKLRSLNLINLSGCLGLESFPEIPEVMENLRCIYLSETAIRDLPSSISNLISLEELHLKSCRNLLKLPDILLGFKSLKLEFDGNDRSSVQAKGDLLFATLFFLASTPYSLLDRHLKNNRCKLEIPKDIFDVIAFGFLGLGENDDFKGLADPSIHQILKQQHLRLTRREPLPDAQEITKERISGWTESISNCHVFTDSSKVDQVLLKEVFTKFLTRMWHLEQHFLGSRLPPSLIIGWPTLVHPDWVTLVASGYSASLRLPHSWQKNNSTWGLTFYIVVAFQEEYCNSSGFSIRCICKSKTSSGSFNTFETIISCWSQNEGEHKIHQDLMLVSYDCSMHLRLVQRLQGPNITFEFYPVDGYNKLLTGCEVTSCAVYMLTAQDKNNRVVLTLQRSDSYSNLKENIGRDNSEELQPPRKRRRSARNL